MKKRILIPTDFSKNAWNALNYATTLYKDEECTFFLLNAYQLYHFTTDSIITPEPGEKSFEEAKATSEKGLEDLLDGLQSTADNSRHTFEMISVYNNVLNAVKEIIKSKEINLVVMGTKGEGNPMNALYGSNAVTIIENVKKCPILVIPEISKSPEVAKAEIVFATNFKYYYKRRELATLVDIASKLNAPIRILNINGDRKITDEQEGNKELLTEYFEGIDHSFHTLTNISVAPGIHAFMESRSSTILALYNRKHGFFSALFTSSLVKELSESPQFPILVLQEHH
ncbi:universal stress protein [Antarcticibacterium arcticum]|uniref:Universal stress protein n=1 Tax=Antarcticibacterium arcticum TaxID=2585771 RepID=A0A5B8YIC1_9FLAO|nr:universal stress protein [Antarcticibacterium arcticum]QED36577.1 universal stress protein [Antarcticibacterium arcticum]